MKGYMCLGERAYIKTLRVMVADGCTLPLIWYARVLAVRYENMISDCSSVQVLYMAYRVVLQPLVHHVPLLFWVKIRDSRWGHDVM